MRKDFRPGDLLRCTSPIVRDGTTLGVGVIVCVVAADPDQRSLTIEYESTDVGVPRKLAGVPASSLEAYVLGPRD